MRDTQCLSPNAQVAYDRIMCEHMRNICIRHNQFQFFTKRLSEDEISELKSVLVESADGFYIEWVHASINKRKAYSESRRQNRTKKTSLTYDNHMKTYDEHMEIEKEKEIVIVNKKEEEREEVKEKKEERKKILNKETIKAVINSIDEKDLHQLQLFIKNNCSNISKLKDQLTFEQASKLWEEVNHQVLGDVIAAMENKADLTKKYKSVYLTIHNWVKNQKSHGQRNSNSSENRFADLEQQLERSLQGIKFEI